MTVSSGFTLQTSGSCNGLYIFVDGNVSVAGSISTYNKGRYESGGYSGNVAINSSANEVAGSTELKITGSASSHTNGSSTANALTVGGAGTTFKYLLILGFNNAIQSQGFERIGIDNVRGDCTNGIDIGTCLDIAYIQNCHFWPYTTTHQDGSETGTNNLAQYDGRQNLRGGIAYRFHTVGDWSKFTNCFSYGYYTGFTITNCNDVQLIGCGADYPSGTNEINNGTYDFTNTAQATYPTQATTTNTTNGYTSVGFIVNGNSHRTKLIGCQAAAQFLAYVVKKPDTNNKIAKTTFTDCSSW